MLKGFFDMFSFELFSSPGKTDRKPIGSDWSESIVFKSDRLPDMMTGETHVAHDIDFKELISGIVGFIEKPDSLIDAEVVDRNIDFGKQRQGIIAPGGISMVSRQSNQIGLGKSGAHMLTFCQSVLYL